MAARVKRSWVAGAGLLLLTLPNPAGGDERLAVLLKSLDLRAYASPTTAPEFSGRTSVGRELSLGQLRGNVVIVNFWATWCAECRPEMPVLERLHREEGERGLAVIGVNARENARAVRLYAKELELSFPLVLDPAGTINALYGVVGLPTTFLIGRDGRTVGFAVGARQWASPAARSLIGALLSEPAARSDRR